MIKAICLLLVTGLAVYSQSSTFIEPPSPCPNVFKYVAPKADETAEPGTEKWYGVVNLTTDITLHALWLNIILDKKADILGNWIGEVTTTDNLNFKIENTKMKLTPDEFIPVRFFIQYNNTSPVPKLQSILFNGKEICSADSLQSLKQKPNSQSYLNTTTVRSTTVASTKSIYDRYQTKSLYKQETTLKPIWPDKTVIEQATPENASKAIVWEVAKAKTENSPRVQYSANSENKHDTQAISKNNSQSKSQSWSQSDSGYSQQTEQTDNKRNKNENKDQFPESLTSSTWAEKFQATSENDVHAVYGSSSNSKLPTWPDKEQDITVDSKQKVVSGSKLDLQPWSQMTIDTNNEKIKSDGDQTLGSLHATTEKVYNKAQVWSSTNIADNPPKRLANTQTSREDTPIIIIANSKYFPNGENLETRPVSKVKNDDRIEMTQEATPISRLPEIFAWFPEQSEKVSGSSESQYSEDDNGGDFNSNLPSSNRYKATTEKQYSVNRAPVINEYIKDSPVVQEDAYFSGGIPTLYIPNQRPEASCGKVTMKPPPFLPPGSTTSEGQWPWQVAIYQQQTVDFKYICGGTLVSYRHVITAAHCVARKNSRREVNKNTLTIYLGKFNLRTSVDGVQIKFVNKIIIHPDYNALIFSRDLAILELRESVTYTDWVRPACLWPENETGLRYIVGKKGSVVGWGSEAAGVPKEELNLIEMFVVAQETCINSLIEFYEKFTSDYTYCAGYSDENPACNGDSGGGMVFKKGNTWYLRGLASISVARSNEFRCDPSHYVIFTDIAKFLPWIEEHIDL